MRRGAKRSETNAKNRVLSYWEEEPDFPNFQGNPERVRFRDPVKNPPRATRLWPTVSWAPCERMRAHAEATPAPVTRGSAPQPVRGSPASISGGREWGGASVCFRFAVSHVGHVCLPIGISGLSLPLVNSSCRNFLQI